MNSTLVWLQAAPAGAISLFTAVLAALVAIFVTVITQWVLGRRSRTDLLTKKLEELYLALSEASAHNVNRFETARPYTKTKYSMSSVSVQGLDIHKKIIMYVRLYFPKLSTAHQAVFRLNGEVNRLIHEAETGSHLSDEQLLLASGQYGDALKAMEAEIVANRSSLVKDSILPRRHESGIS